LRRLKTSPHLIPRAFKSERGLVPGHTNPLQPTISSTRSWRSKPTGAGRNSKSPSIRQAGSPRHTASSASLIHSPKPIKPAHAAMLRFLQQWPSTGHGNHPEQTPMPTRRRSSALKPNSKRFSRYQATRSEKKGFNFIPSLSSLSPKNTGGTRARRTNSDRKRIEGGFFKLRPRAKAEALTTKLAESKAFAARCASNPRAQFEWPYCQTALNPFLAHCSGKIPRDYRDGQNDCERRCRRVARLTREVRLCSLSAIGCGGLRIALVLCRGPSFRATSN